jgi:PST family polysaccharide transporter
LEHFSLKKAALINSTAKFINILIQVIYSAILARVLSPADFGIVAIIVVFINFFMIFADMGIGPAVIQNKTLNENDMNHIFSFTFYLGIVLALLFMILSIPISIFYNNSIYVPLGLILSISLFFNTINMVPNAILLKEKRFMTVGVRMVVISIACSVITIILATLGFKYYSITLYSVLVSVFTFLWNFFSVRLKFRFKVERYCIKKIANFSSYQFAFNFINYFSRNLDNLSIGKFMGDSALGYYDKGYRLMLYPVGNLSGIITPIMHPILSDYQEDLKFIYDRYLKIAKILSLMGVFISLFSFYSSSELVLIVFGDQWISTTKIFKWLSLSIWPQMITSCSGSIFQSLGKTKLMFRTGILTSIITVLAISVGIKFRNLEIVSALVSFSYFLHFFIANMILVKYGFKYSYGKFLSFFLPDVIIYVITGVFMTLIVNIDFDNIYLSIIFKFIVSILIYLFALIFTKQYNYFMSIFRRGDNMK